MSDQDFEYARAIGEKLRETRQQQQLSLRDLAKKAHISASMLSQIETGKAYPSVRSIYSIAAALDVPIDQFFTERDSVSQPKPEKTSNPTDELTASEMREASLNRSSDTGTSGFAIPPQILKQALHASARPQIVLKGGVTWSRLTASAENGVEFLEISYTCGATSGTNLSQHDGREFGLILEGELVVQLGFEQLTLYEGDSIVFDSSTPHRLTNKSSKPMRALWVVWDLRSA